MIHALGAQSCKIRFEVAIAVLPSGTDRHPEAARPEVRVFDPVDPQHQVGLHGGRDLVGERARGDERRLLLQRRRLRKAERVNGVAQAGHLVLERVAIVVADLADRAPQYPENLPCSDEVRRPHVLGKVGKRGPQIGDLPEGEGDRDRLSQLGIVIDGGE